MAAIRIQSGDDNGTIARIRELLKKHRVVEVVKLTGYSQPHVSNIKNGVRHRKTGQLSINSLGLRRVNGKYCRRCGNRVNLVTLGLLCVECGILDLGRQGLVEIKEEGGGTESVG